jgi:hypothetical protein
MEIPEDRAGIRLENTEVATWKVTMTSVMRAFTIYHQHLCPGRCGTRGYSLLREMANKKNIFLACHLDRFKEVICQV